MSSGNNSGMARSTLRSTLRAYAQPAPVHQDVEIADGDNTITVAGLNINADTRIVLVPDQVDPGATYTVTVVNVSPSSKNTLGTVEFGFNFAGLAGVGVLYRIYLTGALGGRAYVGAATLAP